MSAAPFRTIAFRLVVAACLASLAAVAGLCALSLVLVRHELLSSLDADLRARAIAVSELALSAPALLTTPGALDSPSSGRQLSVEVIDARGRVLAASLIPGSSPLAVDALARVAIARGEVGYEDLNASGRHLRVYAAPLADEGGPAAGGAVLVASDTAEIAATLTRLRLVLLLAGLGVAIAATAAAAAMTAGALRPLRRLVSSAREIERTADPSRRLPETGTPDELGQLTGVLNRMLASLQRARAGERRFLADAAHELRTPITALIGNVDYVVHHGADAEALADLRRDAERIARLVEDLLTLEREGAHGAGMSSLALDELVRSTVDLVERERDRDAQRLRLGPLAPIVVQGDAPALTRALTNLIDNAFVHGPPSGAVTISLAREDSWALLSVADEGSGPQPEERERVFERFWRGDGATGQPGSGLGLSIVAAIASRHGGRVSIDGPRFTIWLPAQRAQANSHSVLSES